MEVEIFTLCDNAQIYDGKLVIVGTFNQITSVVIPTIYPFFSIVGRISYEYTEIGVKPYKITFSDPDGTDVFPPFEWKADVKVEPNKIGYINFNINLNQINFTKVGLYKLHLQSEGIDRIFKLFVVEKK